MEAFDEYEFEGPDRSDSEWEVGFDDGNINEPDLQDVFADTERSSRADDCGGLPMTISGNLSELSKEINRLTQDPEESFKRYVGAISHAITEDGLYDISVDDRNKMCRMASRLDNVKYLNPTAYILGFLTTNGGREIDKKIIKHIFTILPRLNDDSVKPPDILRYARFWLNLDANIV